MNPLLKQAQPSPKEGSGSSTMDEQEQKLREKYGKLPPKKNVLGGMKDRKYFDSGDYAMQKAGMSPVDSSPLNVPSSHTPHTSVSNGSDNSTNTVGGPTNALNGSGSNGVAGGGSGLGGGTGLGGEARGGAGPGLASGVEKELRAMEALERPTPDKLPHAQAPSLSSSPVKTSSPPPFGHHSSGSSSFPIGHSHAHHHHHSSSNSGTPSPPGVTTSGIARSPSGSQVFSPLGHNGANPPSSFPIKHGGSTGATGANDPPSPSAMKLSGRAMEIKPEDEEAIE